MRGNKKGYIPWNKGKRGVQVSTPETKNKISVSMKGKNTWSKGRSISEEHRQNISKAHKYLVANGTHHRLIKDRTKLQRYGEANKDRRSYTYNNWRRQVWLRDNFKCKIANPDCKGRIEAHHILAWRDYPELRYQVNNGITLCHAHHPRKRVDEAKLSPYFQQLVAEMK